jgi:hypothetical protein
MKKSVIVGLFILALFAMESPVLGQKTKVLESNPKKKPDWVNSLVKDYVIVVASSTTLEDAQEKALTKVKEQIVSSVAENIQTTSEFNRQEQIKNNKTDYSESFKTATKTRAADIPFIKGISLNQVKEFYWEKVKEGDDIKYYYHIKYPFSDMQLKELVMEFEKADREKTEQLEALINKIDMLSSIEELNQTHNEIKALADGFMDIDPRKDKANVATTRIREMLKSVSIETINATLGEIRFALKIGDKLVTTTFKPKVTSNCAKIIEVVNKKTEWVIKYTYDECYEDPDNKISVECRNSFGKATNDYFFNIKADKIDIFVNDDINLTGGNDNGSEITNANCFISITTKYETAFIIEKIILNFGEEAPVIIDNINKEFKGVGKHDLNLVINQALKKDIYTQKKYNMVKGSIYYRATKSGEKSVYKIYNQNITTAW